MPHSNRPKSKQKQSSQNNKRLQVTDDSGWTHVTTSSRARRLHVSQRKIRDTDPNTQSEKELHLKPSEPPANLTLDDLRSQFQRHYEWWQASESWGVVRGVMLPDTETKGIKDIICIGLGSPSGFLRGGWVDRRHVSTDQLAALVSIKQLFHDVKAYAQDPVFNALDAALLDSLGITVVQHPSAFERVSSGSFLFCPGAERIHLEELLVRKPRALFGGPLEEMTSDGEGDPVAMFLEDRRGTRVPVYEPDEKAFWGTRVYM